MTQIQHTRMWQEIEMAAFFIFVYNLLEQAVKKVNSNDIYVHVWVRVCVCARCVCVWVRVCARARAHVCVCVCVCVGLCIYQRTLP